jgi:spoIIIJ-associated protein
MTTVETATRILDTMLGHLGLAATIEVQETRDGPCLQIHSPDSKTIIGRDGDRLDDLQYLVNRILRRQFPKAERVKVDCEHFRTIREDQMAGEIKEIAERVKPPASPINCGRSTPITGAWCTTCSSKIPTSKPTRRMVTTV